MVAKLNTYKPGLIFVIVSLLFAFIIGVAGTIWGVDSWSVLQQKLSGTIQEKENLATQIASISAELNALKADDQYQRNQQLNKDIKEIEKTYTQTVAVYEDLLRLREKSKNTSKFDERFTQILSLLSKRNYATASAELTTYQNDILAERSKIAASFVIPVNVPVNNTPPGSGFSSQSVQTEDGQFLVSMVAGDLSNTRVIVDTASDSTCGNNCPVLSLGDYVARNGAFAGINGSYFCPSDYPSCNDKKNSFDTLLMNKNKVYFNSDNNVYSTVPAVIFGGGWVRFVGQSLDWGRDTGIDSMIANRPLLVSGGNVVFNGAGEPKEGNRGGRSFVANKGNIVYIGVVFNASLAQAAKVHKTMGMDNAINMDDGGSTALWYGGYKAGPGRAIPNAILFVRR